jgi:hypothetical protein
MHVPLKKAGSFKKRDRYVWVDEIDGKFRRIYVRCYEDDCAKIFELKDETGSVATPIKITRGAINTCVICPYCDVHLFIVLEDYEKIKGVKDIFS